MRRSRESHEPPVRPGRTAALNVVMGATIVLISAVCIWFCIDDRSALAAEWPEVGGALGWVTAFAVIALAGSAQVMASVFTLRCPPRDRGRLRRSVSLTVGASALTALLGVAGIWVAVWGFTRAHGGESAFIGIGAFSTIPGFLLAANLRLWRLLHAESGV